MNIVFFRLVLKREAETLYLLLLYFNMEQNQECGDLQQSRRQDTGEKVLNKAANYRSWKLDLYIKRMRTEN